jgi:pyruvate formate lyase activating enzyme
MNNQPELALFASRCFGCGDCLGVCGPAALTMESDHLQWDPARCDLCGRCVEVCASLAMRWIGRRVTADGVIAEVARDAPFYQEGGGMTLSGGEPTLQPEFAEALLRLAKAQHLQTAMESCGQAPWSVFERLLPYLDLVLYDIKHIDTVRHAEATGVGNDRILENARRIAAQGHHMIIRVPLIPGFNSDEGSLRGISRFVLDLGVNRIDLLPYHRLGRTKYGALGRCYLWAGSEALPEEAVQRLAGLLREQGLRVMLGG